VSNLESSAESLPGPRIQKTKPVFETVEGGQSAPAAREGLPPGYRMRADPHYVDLLASRSSTGRDRVLSVQSIDAPLLADPSPSLIESIKRDGLLQPLLVQQREGTHRLIAGRKRLSAAVAAGLREVPCVVFEVDDEEAARLAEASNVTTKTIPHPANAVTDEAFLHGGADLAQSLATLTACTDLLSGAPSELSRAVAGNLIRAEVWRASCLLMATRIVRRELPLVRGAISVVALMGRLEQAFLPERQLRSVVFDTSSSVPRGSFVAGDEKLLTGALASAILSTLSWLDGVKDARLTMTAALEPVGHVTFTVSQETVAVPEVWLRRAFDHQWTDRPGGIPAAISMLAVRTVAEAHGGTAAVGAGRGTRISILMPTGI
jgi:ParB/RepB/Spo0J family partition protein